MMFWFWIVVAILKIISLTTFLTLLVSTIHLMHLGKPVCGRQNVYVWLSLSIFLALMGWLD